jgi:hypothetical protein
MDAFKLTAWNIEHSDKLIDALADPNATKRARAEMRRDAIAEEFTALGADIFLIGEGPNGEARATDFFGAVAPNYRLVTRGSADRADYGMKGTDQVTGRQWLWFLIRKGSPIDGRLLHLDRWSDFTEAASGGAHKRGKWAVSYPRWLAPRGNAAEKLEFSIPQKHSHWRHPQVLQAEIDGHFVEIIGCHLKSKFNKVPVEGEPDDDDFFENNKKLVAELIKGRVKITTECADIRHYIEARFAEDADAALIVCGDLNDGPGKERIERRFLYHDLIGELQGEIFFARAFLNHALFDNEESERWTVEFRDRLDPGRSPHILLDHILFSQSMTGSHTGDRFAFRAQARGGLVEHQIHRQVTSTRPSHAMTSDHKPVSMTFRRPPPA